MLGIPWPKGWTIVEFFGYPASEYPLKLGVAPHSEIWAPFLRLKPMDPVEATAENRTLLVCWQLEHSHMTKTRPCQRSCQILNLEDT